MSADEFLSQFASSGAALGLLLVSLVAVLFLGDRKLARGLGLPITLLAIFLVLTGVAKYWDVSDPMMAHGVRVAAQIFFAIAAVRVVAILLVDWFLRSSRRVAIPKIV